MNYGFVPLNEYTVTLWMLNFGVEYSDMPIVVYHGSEKLVIYYIFYPTYTSCLLRKNITDLSNTNINLRIEGWNLNTIRFYVDPSIPNTLNIDLYRNLEPIFSSHIDSDLATINTYRINIGVSDANTTSGIIMNEVWVHQGFSVISDINYLISNSSSCGCEYKSPTTPSQTCLQAFNELYNKSGQLCDTSCTNSNLSCYSDTNCIIRSKAECQYGFYDRESLECIFYCPNNSCVCPTLVSSAVSSLLSCSCIAGYKKISDNPQACISNRCLEYHEVVYKYVCDTTENGYILDTSGECCVCASGFTQVQANPILCVHTSICIGHIILGGDYTCSSCSEGYTIDSDGKCNRCSPGYEAVLSNPVVCMIEIENCDEYINIAETRICSRCSEGYSIDSNGSCNECSDSYVNVLSDPFTCALKMDRCNEYIHLGNTWSCGVCEIGYNKGRFRFFYSYSLSYYSYG
jgi:hypothetical protein